MYPLKMLSFLLLFGVTTTAQTINVHGKVSNKAGNPIANAIVTLVHQGLKDTTGADGAYEISNVTAVLSPIALVPREMALVLERGFLQFSLSESAPVKVEIFDIKGNLLNREQQWNAPRGFYRFNIEKCSQAAKILIVRAAIGTESFTFRYLPLHGNASLVNRSSEKNAVVGEKLAKVTAISDTLKVTAPNYTTKSVMITSYDQELAIMLDSAGSVGRSGGCGKNPTLVSGRRQIRSANLDRQYMIRIPEGYDKNHPYPVVFGFHWMGGNMNEVDGGGTSGYTWSYYGIREKADKSTSNKMIFIAPDGISAGWGNDGGRDLSLVDDILKLVEDDLCIDTERLFAMGFSFGGGMSFAVACARAKVFRAVAVYAGAQLSGCDGGKDPIAYIGFHSISDPRCGIAGGRALRDRFVQNNGCTPQNPPQPVGLTHVITEYKGCDEGYPVVWCEFDGGGHTPAPMDGSTNDSGGGDRTWTKDEAWNFFTRF